MAARYVTVGAGPASFSAAETIRAHDPSAQITLITPEPQGYYSRPGLAYFLAEEIPERSLFPVDASGFAELGVHVVHDRVVALRPGEHVVQLGSGRTLPYDRLLLATGSEAIPLGIPGQELDGVVKLDDMADAHDLIRRARRAKNAVVVGGGITALEIVEGLCARGVNVHYLIRRDRYWSNVLSEAESRIVENGLRARGVTVHHFTEAAQVLGTSGRVGALLTTTGEQLPANLIAVAIGVLPRVGLAEVAGLECGRGVLVDEHLCTSDPDIFAAGDLAEIADPATGQRTIEVLWNSAKEKGRAAGLNMANSASHVYVPPAPLNVTRLAGFKITIMGTVGNGEDSDLKGIARGDSETWRRLSDARQVEGRVDGAHLRLAFGEGRIAGAVIMGEQALSFPLQELIRARADASALADALSRPGAGFGAEIERFYAAWSGSGSTDVA